MPVKRKRSKRRVDPVAEAEAWATAFASGHDFFNDLAPFGIEGAAIREAMPEAWSRLGKIYIDRNLGAGFAPHDAGELYALVTFWRPQEMPVKRRKPKARRDPMVEAKYWAEVFRRRILPTCRLGRTARHGVDQSQRNGAHR